MSGSSSGMAGGTAPGAEPRRGVLKPLEDGARLVFEESLEDPEEKGAASRGEALVHSLPAHGFGREGAELHGEVVERGVALGHGPEQGEKKSASAELTRTANDELQWCAGASSVESEEAGRMRGGGAADHARWLAAGGGRARCRTEAIFLHGAPAIGQMKTRRRANGSQTRPTGSSAWNRRRRWPSRG